MNRGERPRTCPYLKWDVHDGWWDDLCKAKDDQECGCNYERYKECYTYKKAMEKR